MRVSEDRYSRDLRRLNLAQRLIRHEVRTQWICAWTGLSDDRVRNLFRSYDKTSGDVRRHRGPSPTRLAAFLRSPTLRTEASAIGGLACAFGAVLPNPAPNARRDRPGVEAGERLCRVFELYRQIVPQSHFTMDQFIRLMIALTEGEDLEIGHCRNCHGALLLDRLGASRRLCLACKQDLVRHAVDRGEVTQPRSDEAASLANDEESPVVYQQPLF
jgi:hypothetical protein